MEFSKFALDGERLFAVRVCLNAANDTSRNAKLF
jgi:hypothetical protein